MMALADTSIIEGKKSQLLDNDSSIVEYLRWRKDKFFHDISFRVNNIHRERAKRSIIQQQKDDLKLDFRHFTEMMEVNKVKRKSNIEINKIADNIPDEKHLVKEAGVCEIPAWLPPLYKQYIRKPGKRIFSHTRMVEDDPLNEICKSRYLRIPDHYLPKV